VKRPPLEIIADRAGVSIATASRVINNGANVAPDTQRRVFEALRDLTPAKKNALSIALVIPDAGNPFFPLLAFMLDQECDRRGASLMMASSDGRADRELHLLERFIEIGVNGIIFIPAGSGHNGTLLSFIDHDEAPPVIALDRPISGYDSVTADPRKGMIEAIDYLVTNGHTRIGYITGLAGTQTAVERLEVFYEALAAHRLDVPSEWVFDGDFQVVSGWRTADALLEMHHPEERPTAILAGNDLMAMGLMQRLTEEGWSLPQQLSVVGFDNIPAAAWVNPRLATIAQPTRRLAREAFNLLNARIKFRRQEDEEPKLISLETKFNVSEHGSVGRHDDNVALRVLRGGGGR
jgi:LacI family transcriptional regulator